MGETVIAVGFGARSNTDAGDIAAAIDSVLAAAGIAGPEVTFLATVDRRAEAAGVRELADDRGWRLTPLTIAELASRDVPHPSELVAELVGTASVAEAAALVAAGPDSALLVPKQVSAGVTVAIARGAVEDRRAGH